MLAIIIITVLVFNCTGSYATSGSSISELASGSLSEDAIPKVLHILAVLPTATNRSDQDNANDTFQWERGEEILPGATLALKEIRDSDYYFLNGYQLEVIPVKIQSCDFIKGVVPFMEELTSNQNNVIGIVGYFCHNLQQRFSYLIQHDSIGILQLSAIEMHKEYCSYCPQHSILPSVEFRARAVIKLIQRLKWNKVAIISNKDLISAKIVFWDHVRKEEVDVALELVSPLITFEQTTQFLHELLISAINIIVAFVSPSEAVRIMCIAQRDKFKWPDYAWIFMGGDINEIATLPISCPQHTVSAIMTNSIFIRSMPWTNTNRMDVLPSGLNYNAYYNAYLEELEKSTQELNISLQNNPYASVLYDSIWAIALTLNRSLGILNFVNNLYHTKFNSEIGNILEEQLSELSFQGTTGFLNFSRRAAIVLTSVELFQYQNGQPELLGEYNVSHNELDLDMSKLSEFPSTTLARHYALFPVYLTVILTLAVVICFVLTIISMCIFFYFRKQPAIKASSSTLSICLFIGCYFHLTSSLFQTINSGVSKHESGEALRGFTCTFDVLLFNLGFDIVFATIIAKTLRIYFIFKPFRRVDRIRFNFCSDQGLFVLILVIVGFKLMLLTLWTCININHLIDIEQFITTSVPPHFMVVQQCHSRNFELWIALLTCYTIILMLIMVTLAILTRKIKRDHFNNTNRINTLTAVLFFHVFISLSLWYVLRLIGETILSKVMFALSTMFTAIFCQAFLIAPKIVPLVYNRIKHGKPVPQRQFSTMSFSSLPTQTTRIDLYNDVPKNSA